MSGAAGNRPGHSRRRRRRLALGARRLPRRARPYSRGRPPAQRVSLRRRTGRDGPRGGNRRRPERAEAPAAARRAGRGQGQHLHQADADDGVVADPGGLSSLPTTRRLSSGSKRPAPSSSARPTATSSRWDRRPRTRRTASRATRGISSGFPAARAADRRRRSPRGWCRWRSARTPAARSGSPRRCAA